MSQINVDNIKNRLGSGAPSFPNGIDVSAGVTTFTNGLNVGTGASVFSPTTNVLALGTNSAERVRIDADGNFNLVNTAGIMTAFKYETPALINNHFKSNSTSSGDYVRMYAGSGTGKWDIYGHTANLRFSDNDGAGNIQMDRPLVMNSQNIVMSSGNGIDFSATVDGGGTTTSELFDDYEEGGWTPTLGDTGTITAGTAEGIYTKIGNICIARVRIDNATFGGSPNDEIRGLPFTAQQRSTTTQVVHANAFTAETVTGLLIQSNTYIAMLRNPTSGSGFWTSATIQTGTTKYIYCTIIYTV